MSSRRRPNARRSSTSQSATNSKASVRTRVQKLARLQHKKPTKKPSSLMQATKATQRKGEIFVPTAHRLSNTLRHEELYGRESGLSALPEFFSGRSAASINAYREHCDRTNGQSALPAFFNGRSAPSMNACKEQCDRSSGSSRCSSPTSICSRSRSVSAPSFLDSAKRAERFDERLDTYRHRFLRWVSGYGYVTALVHFGIMHAQFHPF